MAKRVNQIVAMVMVTVNEMKDKRMPCQLPIDYRPHVYHPPHRLHQEKY